MTIVRPTFFGLYTARSGIVASQANLDVTGQNMSNILTPGYTRQRADLVSIGDSGYRNRIAFNGRVYIGQGVDVNGISQLRDAGYDIRYRQENCKYGYEETKLSGLEDLSRVMDEYYLGNGMNASLEKFMSSIQTAIGHAGDTNSKEDARAQLEAITKVLQQTSQSLDSIYKQQQEDFEITVEKVNTIVQKISALNKQIKEDERYNNPALELKDSRNLLLDQLSGYLNIEYKYNPDDLEELSVDFIQSDGVSRVPLIQGDKYTTISLHTGADTDIEEEPHLIFKFGDKMKLPSSIVPSDAAAVAVTAADCNTGAFGGYFDLLTGDGNFGADTENRGVPYYQKMLDTFANTVAGLYNDINRGKVSWEGTTETMTAEQLGQMTAEQFKDLRHYMKDADGNPVAWQDTDGTPMTAADWANLNDDDKLASFLEANQAAIAAGITLPQGGWKDINGTDIALDKNQIKAMVDANGDAIKWRKANGDLMSEADWENISDEELAAMVAINQNGFTWSKTEQVTWTSSKESLSQANLEALGLAEFKALKGYMQDTAGNPITWKDATGNELTDDDWDNVTNLNTLLAANQNVIGAGVQLPQGSWANADGTASPYNKDAVKNMVDANGEPIAWQKSDGSLMTDADWDNISAQELAAMVSYNDAQGVLQNGAFIQTLAIDATAGDVLKNGAYLLGKEYNLLTANDGAQTINAGNISISAEWSKDAQILNHSMKGDKGDGSADNLLRFVTLMERSNVTFIAQDGTDHGKTVYTGGIQAFASNMQLTQGRDETIVKDLASNYATNVSSLDENRMSISGVDENEETANMLMFQKAFTASSRILTAMDEMLNTLINSTGVVGR